MNPFEQYDLELGTRVTMAIAEEMLRSVEIKLKMDAQRRRLQLKIAPKGVNVERAEVARRRKKNKVAKKARKAARR